MARKPTGTIREHIGRDGLIYRSLKFSAYGKRRFVALGAVDRGEAEKRLRGVLADVERGVWREPDPAPPEPPAMPTLHEFAEQWWIEHEREWRPTTTERYRCCLELHLLPAFGEKPLDRISISDVDGYKAEKLRDGLAAATINKTLVLLSSILEVAEERELISRNPARGRRRRVRMRAPQRFYLDTAEQITALLDAAGQLDSKARSDHQHIHRRAMLATLAFAGLRLGECLDLRWRDVDLASGRLRIGEAKTDAGRRHVSIRPALRDEMLALRANTMTGNPDALVFSTVTGRRHGATNIRKRVMAPAVERANQATPLPEGLTPHSLRRTFASVLYAIGEDPATVMQEMGHSSPALALRIYAQAMRRDQGEKERLRALIEGAEWGLMGIRADSEQLDGAGRGVA